MKKMMHMLRRAAAVVTLISLAPAMAQAEETALDAEVVGSLPPSPATISMRWQLLNPEVNSFNFRNTQDVFAFRTVVAPDEVRPLPQGGEMVLPQAELAGQPVSYDEWAEGTFANALLVLRDGKIVFEDYRNRLDDATRHIGFSMTKTITAMLIGQALERGEIASLDDPISRYVPELADGAYGAASVRDVLEMRSGAAIEERYDFGVNPSLAARIHEEAIILNKVRFADFAVGIPQSSEPGTTFNYATLDTAVLGWVLEEATGRKIEDLIEERIWQPLGAEAGAHILADGPVGVGRALNGMGFNAVLRDWARLGQLLLDEGKVGDTQVLPAGWVTQMSTMKPTGIPGEGKFPGYGFQTWQVDNEPGAYAAVGLAGQYIYVHPETHTVIVKLSYYPPVTPEGVDADVLSFFAAIAKEPVP
tara:strand:+ start:3772 stop:5028 length:1257 start_codon:yes stop_codon:yes gene_type:complete